MATVPVFSPDGTLGDIPQENLSAAVKKGFRPGVNMVSSDGTKGVVPADRYVDAAASGRMKVSPFEEQEIKHPGFWASLGEDLLGVAKGLPSMLPPVQAYHGLQKSVDEWHSLLSTGKTLEQIHSEEQAKEGHGLLYRYLGTPITEGIGVNVTGMEQSAREGDPGGVLGHAAAVPTVMLATEGLVRGLPTAVKATPAVVRGAGKTYNAVVTGGKVLAPVAGVAEGLLKLSQGDATGGLISALGGSAVGRALEALPRASHKITEFGRPAPVYPGARLPEVPAAEVLQSRSLAEGARPPAPEPSSGLGTLPIREPMAEPIAEPVPAHPETISPRAMERGPQPIHGESALGEILTRQDNATLLKIAKSRGINVTKESQLKPGVADSMLVRKIIDDFSPDELQDISAKYMESTRFQHQFGDITPEAWHTMSLGYYFPEVKIPAAALKRSQASIAKSHPLAEAGSDLTDILQKSLRAVRK